MKWIIVCMAAVCLTGCNEAQLAELRTRAAQVEAAVHSLNNQLAERKAEIAKLDAHLERMPEGDDKARAMALREAVMARLDMVQEQLDRAEIVAGKVTDELAQVKDWRDVAAVGIENTAPILPPPWDWALLAAAGALGLRARQNRNTANANRRADRDTGKEIGLPL
jgi:uncharacterized coiled-coil protein SlyX